MLNSFLHEIADKYTKRFMLKHKYDRFSRKMVCLIRMIGKFKLLAKNVKVRLASDKIKQFIIRWVKRWR